MAGLLTDISMRWTTQKHAQMFSSQYSVKKNNASTEQTPLVNRQ